MKGHQHKPTAETEAPSPDAASRGVGGRSNSAVQEQLSGGGVTRGSLDPATAGTSAGRQRVPVAPAGGADEHAADSMALRIVAHMYGGSTAPAGAEPEAKAQADAVAAAFRDSFADAESKFDAVAGGRAPDGLIHRKEDPGATGPAEPAPERAAAIPAAMIEAFRAVAGVDVGSYRIVVGGRADEVAPGASARAFVWEGTIFVPSTEWAPGTREGDLLLAHEIAHLALGHDDSSAHRFEASERPLITNLDGVMSTAQSIAEERGALGMMRWGRFTAGAGGFGAWEAFARGASLDSGSTAGSLPNRYLYTCRAGLVDMRHFYQLMYLALLRGNKKATEMGREHEQNAEETSRFAPEDTTSNALGAWFGAQQSVFQTQSTFVSNLRTFLQGLDPLDFTTMAITDQDAIVNYYSARDAAGRPVNANETATPGRPDIAADDGRDTSLPYTVDPSDPKTIQSFP